MIQNNIFKKVTKKKMMMSTEKGDKESHSFSYIIHYFPPLPLFIFPARYSILRLLLLFDLIVRHHFFLFFFLNPRLLQPFPASSSHHNDSSLCPIQIFVFVNFRIFLSFFLSDCCLPFSFHFIPFFGMKRMGRLEIP